MFKKIGLAALLFVAVLPIVEGPAHATDIYGRQPVRTVNASDVQTQITGADGSSLAQVAASNGAAAGNGLFVLGAVYTAALPTNTTGRAVSLQTDINGRLLVTQDASAGALLENLTKVGGSSIALGSTTSSASLPVVIASDQANVPANIKQVNGSTLSLGQTTKSASLPVALASDTGTLAVTQGAPTGSSFNNPSVTNIAAAGTSAIVCKSGLAISQPTKPLMFTISAPGAVRCQLRFNDNSSMTNFASVVTSPGYPTVAWTPPSGVVGLTTSSTVTTLQYEANCTNFDSVAQDVSCSVVYCQAASGC